MSLIGKRTEIEMRFAILLLVLRPYRISVYLKSERENVLAIMRISRIDFHTPKAGLSLRAHQRKASGATAMEQITRCSLRMEIGRILVKRQTIHRCSSTPVHERFRREDNRCFPSLAQVRRTTTKTHRLYSIVPLSHSQESFIGV